jgi:hypothetical protein
MRAALDLLVYTVAYAMNTVLSLCILCVPLQTWVIAIMESSSLPIVVTAEIRDYHDMGVGNARERSEQGVTGPNNDAGPFALSSLCPPGPRNQPL